MKPRLSRSAVRMTRYEAYGIVLKSPPLLPQRLGRLRGSHSVPEALGLDVFPESIKLIAGTKSDFANVHETLNGQLDDRAWFRYLQLPDGRTYLRWRKLFECLLSTDGRWIISQPLSDVSLETIQTYLLGQVLSFALLRLGVESLHATTVVMHDKAVAFVGDCGYGKSTLAAACLAQGHRLLTDDLLVLRHADGCNLAFPGLPRIKLMPGIARRLLGATVRGFPMNPFTSKLVIPLQARQFARSPVPLHTVYIVHPPRRRTSSRVVIRRLSGRQAWYELTKGTFNPVARDPARLKTQFAWAGRLAERIPVKSLSYPRSLRALPEVVRAVAADFSR